MNNWSTSIVSARDGISKNRVATRLVFIVALTLVAFPCAWANEDDLESLYTFLQGTYEVIGKWPDSQQTYSGIMVLSKEADLIRVTRTISGERTEAVGKIETITADQINVLRVRFARDGEQYEAIYLIGSDLDNYGRLTGYVYSKERPTEQPGLEALFYDRNAES
ncbi:MAG: hypothetical protein RBS57_15585 [Desulforhabdus sp.]|jgi:hypothetical protein|nr:hypothetical protein [Desulforhabdus sp.]